MRKTVIKAIVLPVIFVAAVIIFSIATNKTNEDLTTEMSEATLPVITLYSDGAAVNELHGYTSQMDAAYMRDTITPVPDDRKLPVTVQTYQTAVDKISYEIRSLDASRLIANADVSSYTSDKGKLSMELTIQNLLESGEEYLLVITLESGDKSIYYYTRIIEPEDCHVAECVQFAQEFHDTTFNAETLGTLSLYLERTTGDNTTLQYTTLNNSLKQIGWGDFGGACLTEPVPSIKEITTSYCVIVLDYVLTRVNEQGETEYYNVEEYYRVRYTETRMYLLNFERTVGEIFRGENDCFSEDAILLGIRNGDVEYETNGAGDIVAFVQEGELWSYNRTENTLAKVFSFRGYEGIDDRENYGEHDIRIMNVDETGSIDYIVYGYMNRGIHEGEVGIAVYRYDSLLNTNEERVFLPSSRSYEVMKSELEQLMYVTEGGMFYVMVDGAVYGIDLNTLEKETVVDGLEDGYYAISESKRFFVWGNTGGGSGSSTLSMIDFSTEKVTEISEGASEYVRPLGFMEEDFVYGVARASDVVTDAAGNVIFPMYKVRIVDSVSANHTVLKTYQKDGYYVQSITIESDTIYLQRIQNHDGAYVDADEDMIRNSEASEEGTAVAAVEKDDGKETQIQLVLDGSVGTKAPKLLTPKETILEETREIALDEKDRTDYYYVYVKGDVMLATGDVAKAVTAANDGMGVVIDGNQEYVWKRARKTTRSAFSDLVVGEEDADAGSIAQCVNVMLEREGINICVSALIEQGETPKQILEDALKDADVLDLTGCAVDGILYYISSGAPVFAMTDADEAVLIVGYDANNIILYNPVSGITSRQSVSDADELFADAGSVFLTYRK